MDQANDKDIIKEKIKKLDKQINLLTSLRQNLIDKLNTPEPSDLSITDTAPIKEFTPDEKIALFKSYFRGRDDAYAKLWTNNRTGKHGYSPVCKNEWDRLLCSKAKYILGLTATPYRRDGHQPIIHMQCGPICHQIKQSELPDHFSGSSVIVRETDFICEWNDNSKIHEVWLKLVSDEQRNQIIIDDIVDTLNKGRFPLILTERREHLEKLAEMLKGKTDYLALLYVGLRKKATREIIEKLKESPDNIRKVILATGSYIGEGFDEPRLDTLFLTMPSSFKGKIVQYTGRLHRFHKNKQDVKIYDYMDKNVSVLEKMFKRRIKTYKMLGYEIR